MTTQPILKAKFYTLTVRLRVLSDFIFAPSGRQSLIIPQLCRLTEIHRQFPILTDWQKVTEHSTFEPAMKKIIQFHNLTDFHVSPRLLPEIPDLCRLVKSDRQFYIMTNWQKVTGYSTFKLTMKKFNQFHTQTGFHVSPRLTNS